MFIFKRYKLSPLLHPLQLLLPRISIRDRNIQVHLIEKKEQTRPQIFPVSGPKFLKGLIYLDSQASSDLTNF